MATIKDVARLAGVSVSTVSNVLNNKGSISDEKYHKIMEAVNQLNYRPSMLARNLKKQRTRFVSVLLPRLENHYAMIYKGIQKILTNEGYHIILQVTNDNPVVEEEIIKSMVDIGVCGLLLVPANTEISESFKSNVLRNIPMIYVERSSNNLQSSSVVFNNQALIADCAKEKIAQYGPENVALITGYIRFSSNADCVEGFLEAFHSSGPPEETRPILLQCGSSTEQAFSTLFERIPELPRMPRCFIVSDVSIAKGLQEMLALTGDSQVEIVALSGDNWCLASKEGEQPALIERNACELGEKSAGLLLEYMRNTVLFENRVVVVNSPPQERPAYPYIAYIAAQQNKRLNVLLLESPTSEVMRKLSADYSRRYGYDISFTTLDYLPLYDRLIEEFQQGKSRYDVCMVDIPWINSFGGNGYLHNLSPLMEGDKGFLDDYPASVRRSFIRNQNQIYGLPVMATIQFLFYRKDLFVNQDLKRSFFNQYGFELRPPHNWTEFNVVAAFFTRQKNPQSPVEYGTSICGINPIGLVDEFFPRQWTFGGKLLDDNGSLAVYSPENLRALANMKTTYGLSPPECDKLWWDNEFCQLIGGRYAMIQGFASHYPILEKAEGLGELHNQIGVMPVPGNKPMLGGWILGVNRQSQRVQEGYSFIRWAVGSERSVQSMLLGGAVPTKETFQNTLLRHIMPWMGEMEQGMRVGGKREIIRKQSGKIIDPYWLDSQMAQHILDALQERCTMEEALAGLQKKIAQAMETE